MATSAIRKKSPKAPARPGDALGARLWPALLPWILGAGLLILVAAAFWPVMLCDFINWDDPQYLLANPMVGQGLSWQGIRWAFTTPYMGYYIPLTWLSLMCDASIFGLDPAGFHGVNLLLHGANAVLTFLCLRRATGSTWRSAGAAALFAVHPLRVESVAWVVERKDVLSGFFGFAAMLAYLRYAEKPTVWRYVPAVILFAFSLLAKPMTVTLPAVLLLMDFWPLRRVALGKPEPQTRENPPRFPCRSIGVILLEKVPLMALAIGASIATVIASKSMGLVKDVHAMPISGRLANAVVAYGLYLRDTVWPDRLCAFYPIAPLAGWQVLGAAAILVGISGFALLEARRRPWFIIGWLWFLGALVPQIGIVQVFEQSRADRFTYFPFIGLGILIAWSIPSRWAAGGRSRWILSATSAAVLLGLTLRSNLLARSWQDSQTLFTRAIALTGPNSFAEYSLADALAHGQEPDLDGAIDHLQKALAINDNIGAAHDNLGMLLVARGNLPAALTHFRRAADLDPNIPEPRINVGMALVKLGEFPEAIVELRSVAAKWPETVAAHDALGSALLRAGRREEARKAFEISLRLNPGDSLAQQRIRALSSGTN